MLKTVNYAVFKCLQCGKNIKVNPSQVVENVSCDCAIEKATEEPKPVKRTRKKKEVKEDA